MTDYTDSFRPRNKFRPPNPIRGLILQVRSETHQVLVMSIFTHAYAFITRSSDEQGLIENKRRSWPRNSSIIRHYITTQSPSFCFVMLDRECRSLDFCTFEPPLLSSSRRSRAFGKFCATIISVVQLNPSAELTSSPPIPPLSILQVCRCSNSHF